MMPDRRDITLEKEEAHVRKGVLLENWLGSVLGCKLRILAAVALANKMARMIWAMMTREENYPMA